MVVGYLVSVTLLVVLYLQNAGPQRSAEGKKRSLVIATIVTAGLYFAATLAIFLPKMRWEPSDSLPTRLPNLTVSSVGDRVGELRGLLAQPGDR